MLQYIQDILTYFRNLTLNAAGVERDLYHLLADKDVSTALNLMEERDDEVDAALREYNPQTHPVMRRRNKYRKGQDPYISEKLPRSRQRYINEVELFFLLGNPIVWKKRNGSDKAFARFNEFLNEQHFNSRIREAKRLAGAETESALLYNVYRDDRSGERRIKSVVLARSKGYRLRPLIDQFGVMKAFAYGYTLKEGGRNVQHWDFQTADMLFYAKKGNVGWEVESFPNPTGKINAIYFRQPKAWDGVERRLEREESLDSKVADTNNYFADPIATATADVIDSMADPSMPGKLIQLTGEKSHFGYVNPPQSSELRNSEKRDLQESILFDTYTPDFSFDNMRGMGTLSGAAIRNAMILGYIKRENRKEIYDELIGRHGSLTIALLRFLYPDEDFDGLEVEHEFAEPFDSDRQNEWNALASLYQAGLVSLEEAVEQLAICGHPEAEIERIRKAEKERQTAQQGEETVGLPEPEEGHAEASVAEPEVGAQ